MGSSFLVCGSDFLVKTTSAVVHTQFLAFFVSPSSAAIFTHLTRLKQVFLGPCPSFHPSVCPYDEMCWFWQLLMMDNEIYRGRFTRAKKNKTDMNSSHNDHISFVHLGHKRSERVYIWECFRAQGSPTAFMRPT